MSGLPSSGKAGQVPLDPEQRAAKRAFARVVSDCGGLDAAELECRVSSTQLQRYCSPHHDAFPPVDVIRNLEAIGGAPHVTEFLARHSGFTLIERPKIEAPDCASLHAALKSSMQESAESHCALLDALGDGHVTAEKARTCMKEAIEAAEEHLRVYALLKRIADEC